MQFISIAIQRVGFLAFVGFLIYITKQIEFAWLFPFVFLFRMKKPARKTITEEFDELHGAIARLSNPPKSPVMTNDNNANP